MNSRCLSRLLGTVIATVALSLTAPAAPADLDSGFGTNGKVTTDFGGRYDLGHSVVVQSDGKIILAGYSFNGSNDDVALVRYHADGTLDDDFGTGGKVITDIGGSDDGSYSVAVQSDGKIVVAGYASGSTVDIALVRYHEDGTLDSHFGAGGKVITDIAGYNDVGQSVAVQSDGRIVVAGDSFDGSDSGSDFVLVCYQADGTLDTSFGTDGKVVTDFSSNQDRSRSVAVQSDGKIVVAGISGTYPASDIALVRYDADGTLDSSFGTDGRVTTDIEGSDDGSHSVAVQSDGKIVVGGYSLAISYAFALVRYDEDGTLDSSFGTGGKVITHFGSNNDLGQSVAVQGNGKILVAGYSSIGNNDEGFALVRYTATGALDDRFGTNGKVMTDFGDFPDVGRSLVLQSDGKIVVAGYSGSFPNNDFALVRYLGGEVPLAPELDVQHPIGTSITSGSRMDIGSVSVGSAADLTFIIANTGTADLILTGSPDKVAVGGADANLFTVTTTPAPTVAAESTTTFIVRFTPASIGTMSATLTITSNDAARSPFTITLDAAAHLGVPVNRTFLVAGGVTSDAAPGAGGASGLPPDAKLASFNPPAIDDDGNIAFIAKWTSASSRTKGSGLFLNDDTCLAVLGGDASAVGGQGAMWKSFSDPVVSGGRVVCLATLAGVPKTSAAVIVGNLNGVTLGKIARAGEPAAGASIGGATFKSFTAVTVQTVNDIPRVAFLAQLTKNTGTPKVDATNDMGVWYCEPNDPRFVVRESDEVAGRTIKTLAAFKPGNGSPGQGRGTLVNSTISGAPLFTALALFTDRTQGLIAQNIHAGPPSLALSLSGNTAAGVDDGATFAGYGLPARNRNEVTAFLGTLTIADDVTKADARGIFTGPDGTGKFATVIRTGRDATAAGTGTKFSVLKDPVVSDDGDIAFLATVKGGTAKGAAGQTIWWQQAGQPLGLLAQGGTDVGSDLPGAKWKSFTSLAIAGGGRGPIFAATLLPNKTNVDKTNATGVWACDLEGNPRLLFRTGDQIDVGAPGTPVLKKLKSFTLLKATVGSTGVTRSFNHAAQVVWLATFTDKSQAIVTTEVP